MGFRIVKLALALLISWSAAVCAQNGTMSPGDNTTVGDGNTTVGDGNTTIGDGGTTGYLDIGTVAWEKGIGQVDRGNGVFISPNGLLLVVVRKDAVVNAFNPRNGAELWTYTPEDMARASSFGGAFFSTTSTGQDYVMVTVTMDAIFPYQATSTVIALNPANGEVLYTTDTMVGVTKGTPVASADGSVIVVTHNIDKADGYVSIFNYGEPAANLTFAASSVGNGTYPFGAVGYCYKPLSGSYPGGEGNSNDLFMWSADAYGNATQGGDGRLFAFQMPVLNPFNATDPKVFVLGNSTVFQSPNPPVFANQCYLMYISSTKSEVKYWEASGQARDYFDKNAAQTVGFLRGEPRYAAAEAPVTLSSSDTQPIVYGPSAGSQLFRMPYDLSDSNTVITTPAVISNKVHVSPDDLYVYYATMGMLYQADATTLDTVWNITVGAGGAIYGEIAQSPDGAYIYVADSLAMLTAVSVKAAPPMPPTLSPTAMVAGSDVPSEESDAPTPASGGDGDAPTLDGAESNEPSASPEDNGKPKSPVAAPTAKASSAAVVSPLFGCVLAFVMTFF